ncbi:hypothetical protein BC941DRAFT_399392 [Chlamydoabsidia padenii]|nr:hypothetical protein BC941DRAFT_399392 [Chlamydoabsidia padenii]
MSNENEPEVSGSSAHQDTETSDSNTTIGQVTSHQSHSENEQQSTAPSEDKPSPYHSDSSKEASQVETPNSSLSITTRTSSIIQHTNNNDIRQSSFDNTSSNKNITLTPLDQQQRQEDTFYQSLQIRLLHSVGSMSISPTCRDVVLAGRQGLVIIDLENPWLIPRILPHMSKWEVADVQWSPYVSRESWVASTSNQKLLIWNLNSSSQVIEHALPAHTRAISDINWSPHHPDIVATCSVDTYVRVWDLRCAGQSQESRDDDHYYRPANSFTPWNAAATQVKFNFKNEYLVASAHDKDVKIWDMRKGAVPMTSITAHSKKIYGIDWSRQNDYTIVTCSLDKLVKYWNIHSPDEAEETIITNSPVWRARNTPFGEGVLTMPQRSESTLYLYGRATPDEPVHLFEGHTDTVKEFVWRWKGGQANSDGDDREFQLVTWSKDQNLRLWPVSEEITKAVGHQSSSKKTCYPVPSNAIGADGSYHSHSFQETPVEDEATDERSQSIAAAVAPIRLLPANTLSVASGNVNYSTSYNFPSNNYREQKYTINPLLWMQNVKTIVPNNELKKDSSAGNTYQSLAEELSTVLNKYASVGVKTEKVNAAARTCTISLHGPWLESGTAFLRITIRFGPQYPDNSPPEFDIQKNSMISIYYRTHMAQDLSALAANYTSQKRWCLEPCIRYLLGETMQEDEPGFTSSNNTNGVGLLSSSLSAGTTQQEQSHTNKTNTDPSTASNAISRKSALYGADSDEIEGAPINNKEGTINTTNYVNNWNGTTAEGDSDDEIFVGPSFMGGYGMNNGKRGSLQSERGIVLDLSSKHSTDEKVPFPRLCGAVFSGSGQLTCFFSTLRLRDPNRSAANKSETKTTKQETSPSSNTSNGEYFEHTYQDFYKHPKSYEQFEEYKEIAAMSRQGRNATVMVGSGGAFGEYTYDDPDDIDDGLTNMASIYFKPDGSVLDNSMTSEDHLLYHGAKSDRITHNVMIADFSEMLPFSPWLAKEFILLPDNPMKACLHNSQASKTHERDDLVQIWNISMEIIRECVPLDIPDQQDLVDDLLLNRRPDLQPLPTDPIWLHDSKVAEINSILGHQAFTRLLADINGTKDKTPNEETTLQTLEYLPKRRVRWGSHPLGQRLVDNMLQHFMRAGDIQMSALLTCIFHDTYIPMHDLPRQDLKMHRSWGSLARSQSRSGGISGDEPKSSTVDYFSMKKTKQVMHRTNSGPNLNVGPQVNRNSSHVQLSQSYGTKGVNFLSYFWDNDRRTPPSLNEKSPMTETPTDMDDTTALTSPNTRNNKISNRMTTRNQPWMSMYSGVKIPSNTAPGIRPTIVSSLSSHGTSCLSTPPPLLTSPSVVGSRVSTPLLPPGSLPLSTPNVLPLGPVTVANKEGEVLATDELSIEYTNVEWFDMEKLFVYNQTPLLPINKSGQHDVARWQYSDLLFRNDLLAQRAEVLKFISNRPTPSSTTTMTSKERTMELQVRCYICESEVAGSDRMCYQCRKIRTQIKCTICHQLVKGLVNFCIKCRHGGHSRHLKEWFQIEEVCPTGCGCRCLVETLDFGTTVL